MTHCHKDHFDETAERLLPRDVPVFCQPEDEERLRAVGLDVRPVGERMDWDGLAIHRTPARHGFGAVADALAPVSGFVLDDLYLAGDTVWYEAVEETIERFAPRVAVVHASAASFLEGGRIVMDIDDVREVVSRVPVVVAVHFEAINHCHLSRAELRAAVPSVRRAGRRRDDRGLRRRRARSPGPSVRLLFLGATDRRSGPRRPR